MMKISFLGLSDGMGRTQSQMRLKKQPAQYVTEALIREVSFVESADHPLVEEIQLWIQKLIIRLEGRSNQTRFGLQSSFNRSARIRQHAAKGRDRPTVANELFEESYVLPNATKRGIRID